MSKSGTHITNVRILEQLKDGIICSGNTMESIDASIINHFNAVKYTLERKLEYFQKQFAEATEQMNNAAEKMVLCHNHQHYNQEGELVPSCNSEECAFSAAEKEMYFWKNKYERAKQIVDECQHEIASYYAIEHILIQNMCAQQAPEMSRILSSIIDKIYAILGFDLELQTYSFLTDKGK